MTRKDSEKDSDRPHYYSQFWLDVAAGRKIIGAPRPDEGNDHTEVEMPEAVSTARRGGRATASPIADGHREMQTQSVVEPQPVAEEYEEPLDDEEDFFDEEEDEEEDDEWSLRGRKKPKPGRQQKPPKPTKKPKRGGRF